MIALAEARSQGLEKVAKALDKNQGKHAASLMIAENYVHAFGNLAKTSNTLILPANASDVTGEIVFLYS